jgi:glycine dehydrogenase subunit 2
LYFLTVVLHSCFLKGLFSQQLFIIFSGYSGRGEKKLAFRFRSFWADIGNAWLSEEIPAFHPRKPAGFRRNDTAGLSSNQLDLDPGLNPCESYRFWTNQDEDTMSEKLSFEMSIPGRRGHALPQLDVPRKAIEDILPAKFLRKTMARLPELSEPQVVRHYVALSRLNHHVDKGLYPLGSCTMKYNPKINEDMARLPGFSQIHPFQSAESVQGALQLMDELRQSLAEISGLADVSLQPAAGAHGELTGLMMIRAYHESLGNPRKTVLIPDSAHGTNPASVTVSGYTAVQIKSDENGLVDLADLKKHLNPDVAALMLTNPNTLGLFEKNVTEIAKLLQVVGALLYMDGANLNALLGIARPGDFGVDVLHFNLHKTFSTPHGGGGPGSGPVGVSAKLVPFLPVPIIRKTGDKFCLDYDRPQSVGKVATFWGNFGVMVRAFTYIRQLGATGLRRVSENAIINANYLMQLLKTVYDLPYPGPAMHEFVLSAVQQKKKGARALDIAKRLLDYGFHAPTVYFPLIVREAMMIEPTETESREALDDFVAAMLKINEEIETDTEKVQKAPFSTPVSRLDEVFAVKAGEFRYQFPD